MEPLGGCLVRWSPPGRKGAAGSGPEEAEGFRPRAGERGCELEEGQSLDQEASQIPLVTLASPGLNLRQGRRGWQAGVGGGAALGGWSSEAPEQSLVPCGRWGSPRGILQKPQSCSWVGWEGADCPEQDLQQKAG